MSIDGTWSLDSQSPSWARVSVHLPDTGAQTQQAAYTILNTDLSDESGHVAPKRTVQQRAGRWVSLGVFHFIGTPKVKLSNTTKDGTGDDDVAWGAVAFQPLPGKPKNMIVAMGDSYSSGEGASEGDRDYYPETNYRNKAKDDDDPSRNACHRSTYAWSRQAAFPSSSKSIGALEDGYDNAMDYHLIACSGARTYNVLNVSQGNAGDPPQLEQGYLNRNTTLVTMSIGGNDARFVDIFSKCVLTSGNDSCSGKTWDSSDEDVEGRDAKFLGQPMATAIPGIINEIVRPDIVKTLQEIHNRAPNAKVILMGYPPLLSNDGVCLKIPTPPGLPNLGLSSASAAWLNSIAGVLATAMQGAADDMKKAGAQVEFADPKDDFRNQGICGDPEQVHGLVVSLTKSDEPKKDWPIINKYGVSAQSFHPKIGGARLYANTLERKMKAMGL
ncbi:SGNH/GDSL hydrolase family protein [Streptomyces sp. SID1034]|uniref:SGNH/GDSL hydrolase family protein n=1 Tax=Streptomyces sp. SID1034 TaxID=2690248 RepID=UPI001371CE4E|nr:SGNH/GDSL hydrolase family protein [Streptomyces sp. SID1034]MYV95932.1 hypothetical protein [Streptomyces sp. SID1034]